jgi:Na+/H+ antiporter NhaD/arsenite permease-like protein
MHDTLGAELGLWTVLPFVSILLAIALFPLFAAHWWEHNRNKGIVAAALALPVALYLPTACGAAGAHVLLEKTHEYVSFITLLAALFVITGGVYVRGSLSGTPLQNTMILAVGALIASVVGTTGASALLIRPLLRANAPRQRVAHIVVFFIFIVSNCGGLLTPLGVDGLHNLLFLAGVVLVIYGAGAGLGTGGEPWPHGVQEAALIALTVAAYLLTAPEIRARNRFGFGPIVEVAVLFAGIFVTMAPALLILNAWGHGERTVLDMAFTADRPWQFFWASGSLSSFLDNAPTYLTFTATAAGTLGVDVGGQFLKEFLQHGAPAEALLAAISCGSVFMGANSYIGHGPNFMVKAIAEESGVRMPSFFGYMAYSVGVLIPIFVVVTFVFFD